MVTLVNFFSLAIFVSLYDAISYDVINANNFHDILRYFFKILARSLLVAYSLHCVKYRNFT